jgi:uncharacterized protein YjiS (DUF1127 family)
MIMRTVPSGNAALQGIARQFWAKRVVPPFKRWLVAFWSWKAEQAAIARLHSMTDRELKDIGLTRSVITGAVVLRGHAVQCCDAFDA